MAKAIHPLRIFMFRDQFKLDNKEISGIRQVCIFILRFYVLAWFKASYGILAPNSDLLLMKNLLFYDQINPLFAKMLLKKSLNIYGTYPKN